MKWPKCLKYIKTLFTTSRKVRMGCNDSKALVTEVNQPVKELTTPNSTLADPILQPADLVISPTVTSPSTISSPGSPSPLFIPPDDTMEDFDRDWLIKTIGTGASTNSPYFINEVKKFLIITRELEDGTGYETRIFYGDRERHRDTRNEFSPTNRLMKQYGTYRDAKNGHKHYCTQVYVHGDNWNMYRSPVII